MSMFSRKERVGWFGLLAVAVLLATSVSCAGLARRAEDALDRGSIPTCKEKAQSELDIANADIAASEAWIAAGPSVKVTLRLSEKAYDTLLKEATDNLAYKKVRRDRLVAVLPTLSPCQPQDAPTSVP